jgi:1,4-alpha-glucan branching enzyme
MSIKKQYLKTKPLCKVTFEVEPGGHEIQGPVRVVGDFNQWDTQCEPMKKQKDGTYKATVELEPGKEYQFKYLINQGDWKNDPEADKFYYNEFASENSVIVV